MKKLTRNQKITIVGIIITAIIGLLSFVFKEQGGNGNSVYNVSSQDQGGGVTAGVVNIGEIPLQPRRISDELKKSLQETKKINKLKCIYVENRQSKESLQFASEINNFLKGEGIESIFYSGTMFMLNTDINPSKEGVIIQDESHADKSNDCVYIFILAQLDR
ncbi:MAG: hypothetical protein Q7S11_01325 [bacterium]|nr:hypothetical protein [bacterium]